MLRESPLMLQFDLEEQMCQVFQGFTRYVCCYMNATEEREKNCISDRHLNAVGGQSHYYLRTPVRGCCIGVAAAAATQQDGTGVLGLAVTPASVTSPIVSEPTGSVHPAPGPLPHLASGTLPINLLSFVIISSYPSYI